MYCGWFGRERGDSVNTPDVAPDETVYSDERIRKWIDYELSRRRDNPRINQRAVLFRLAQNMRDEYEALLRKEREK